MNMLNRAIELAISSQGEQTDKSGQPYIFHLLRVMLAVKEYGEEHMIVGVLHDLLEDTSFPAMYLPPRGYSDAVCRALNAITKRDGEPYDDYLLRVELNPIARIVKLADLRDNLGRLGNLSEADQARLRPKYEAAIKRLSFISDREPTEEEKKTGMELVAMAQERLERNKLSQPTAPRTQGRPKWLIEEIIRDVAELPDRSSPEGWPEAMLVTGEELQIILERYEPLDFCASPCGHSSQYAYTENGGKNIVCLLCERAQARTQPAPKWIIGMPSAETVRAHESDHPRADGIRLGRINVSRGTDETFSNRKVKADDRSYGEWICFHNRNSMIEPYVLFIRLKEVDGEVLLAQGFTGWQPLAETFWENDCDYLPVGKNGLPAFFTALPEATNQLKEVQFALERDRTKVAECLTAVRKELQGYDWLIEGRGCYEWGDDRWHDEFRKASAAIYKAIEPMVKIAADWTNCPMTTEDVKAARTPAPGRQGE